MRSLLHIVLKICLLWLLGISTLFAQSATYAVNVQVSATPPYPSFLYEFQTGSNLMVNLVLRDLTVSQLEVYLNIELEGAGIRLTTPSNFRPSSFISLDPGVPLMLSNPDLAEYLQPAHLLFEGTSRESFLATDQQLPQGLYKLKVTVLNALTGKAISNQAIVLMGIYKGQPPIINLPFHNKTIPTNDLQTFTVQWINRNSAAFNASNPAGYRLQMWELPETGLDPNVVVNSNYPTLLDEYLSNTTYQYGPANATLIPGRKYAIRVQAVDPSGRDLFTNNGYSQVVQFTYGGGCVVPTGLSAKAEGNNLVFNWAAVGTKGYTVKYKRIDQIDTTFEDVLLNTFTLRNLPPNSQYLFWVAALCDGDKLSAYTQPISIFTLPEGTNNLANCGAKAPKINVDNQQLLPILRVGETFKAYDFDIKVTRMDCSDLNGHIGEGTTQLNMLGGLPTVVTFQDIHINTDYQLVAGRVDFQQKPYVFSDERLNDFADDLKKSTQSNDEPSIAQPTTIDIQGTISGISLNADKTANTVTYTDDKGKSQTKTLETGKDYKLTDKTGDIYLIAKDGSVSKQAKATAQTVKDGPANGGQNTNLFFGDSSLTIAFFPHPDQRSGYDSPDSKSAPETDYEFIQNTQGKYGVAWKSIPAGETDLVKARLESNPKNIPITEIKFKTNSGQEVRCEYDPNAKEWTLTLEGTLHRQDFSVYPYYKKGNEEILCGKLNVMPLDRKTVNLVLVLLKGFSSSSINITEIGSYLNKVYSVANAEIKISFAPTFEHATTQQPLGTEHGKLTDYSASQASLIFAFQQAFGEPADNTLYLFLSPQASPSGSFIKGHTPVNRSYGFLFNTTDNRTIAHELAHGYPMALEHPFADASLAGQFENLLSYNNSTLLSYKQWGLIHQPPVKVRTGQRDKEGQYQYADEKEHQEIARFITQIRCGISKKASTALLHYGWLKYEGIKIGRILPVLSPNGPAVTKTFKEATISIYINAGYVSEVVEGYRDIEVKLPSKDFNPQKGLTLNAVKGTMLFIVSAEDAITQAAVYKWLLAETGLDGENHFWSTVVYDKNWTAEEMFRFSDCELEQLSREIRESLIEYLKDNLRDYGRPRDTYQYLLVNALKTIPIADKAYFYGYFKKRPVTIQTIYEALADNQKRKFVASMVELWQVDYLSSKQALSDPYFRFAFTKSIFGNESSSIHFQEGKIYLLPEDPSFAIHPFEPCGIAFSSDNSTYVTLPALLGLYVSDLGKGQDLKDGLSLATDMALLTVGVGEVALSLKAMGTARSAGLASRQFLKATLRQGLGSADMIASISSTYCNLSPQSNTEFCKTWQQYDKFVTLGLLTATTTDLIYTSLSKSYTQEIHDALAKVDPKKVEFLEEELGLAVTGEKALKLSETLRNTYDELIKAGFQATIEGSEILFKNSSNFLVAKIADNSLHVKIPYDNGWAKQSSSFMSSTFLGKIEKERKVYRLGTLNRSQAGEAQFWSPESPFDYKNIKDYADKYGIPYENLKGEHTFFEVGIIPKGIPFITREAPAVGINKGGSIEVVVPEKSVKLESFSTVKFDKE